MSFTPLLPGPWEHAHVAANGARFHVAVAGPEGAPTVVLLHGFPQFWWTWRHQLTALSEAGLRVVAMDLRGYGGSDKTPRGYDPFTLAGDVAGVIRALGLSRVLLAGHGWGGLVAWTAATLHDDVVAGLVTLAAPHPRTLLRSFAYGGPGVRHVLAMQVPWLPERRLRRRRGNLLDQHLRSWAAPGSRWPSTEEVETYRSALALWPAPHCALEYHRWLLRSRLREDGRRFGAAMRAKVRVPVLTVHGGADPVVRRPWLDRSGGHVAADHRSVTLPGVGHFLPEEAPAEVAALLREAADAWL